MNDATTSRVWPNFLIIGAAKSGTTALYHQLKQHPDVYMSPVKEPAFFAQEDGDLTYRGPGDESAQSRIARTIDEYLAHFDEVGSERTIGEASVVYLYSANAPANIKRRIPDVRLIAILRNPVERAFSNYLDNVRHGFETESTFAGALAAEQTRLENGWSWYWRYRDIGFYARQLGRYFEHFDREQIRVHLYDDYVSDPAAVVSDCFRFLGVDPSFEPDLTSRFNVSGLSRSNLMESLIKRPNLLKTVFRWVTTEGSRGRIARSRAFQRLIKRRPAIQPDVAERLAMDYRDDITELERLTGRDLHAWLDTFPS